MIGGEANGIDYICPRANVWDESMSFCHCDHKSLYPPKRFDGSGGGSIDSCGKDNIGIDTIFASFKDSAFVVKWVQSRN